MISRSRRALLSVALAAALALAACGTEPSPAAPPRDGGAGQSGLLVLPDSGAECPDASALHPPDGGACIPTRSVSYASDVLPIFATHCNGESCHNGTWGSGAAYRDLVGKPSRECCEHRFLVLPGHPAESYVIHKLRGVGLCGGRPMPLGGALPPADLQTIEDWICEGAPR